MCHVLTNKSVTFQSVRKKIYYSFSIYAITLDIYAFYMTLHGGITADTVCKGNVNFPLHNQFPIDSSCSDCCLVKVYLTNSGKVRICLKNARIFKLMIE